MHALSGLGGRSRCRGGEMTSVSARGAMVAFSFLLATASMLLVIKTSADSIAVVAVASAMFAAALVIAVWMARVGEVRTVL